LSVKNRPESRGEKNTQKAKKHFPSSLVPQFQLHSFIPDSSLSSLVGADERGTQAAVSL